MKNNMEIYKIKKNQTKIKFTVFIAFQKYGFVGAFLHNDNRVYYLYVNIQFSKFFKENLVQI